MAISAVMATPRLTVPGSGSTEIRVTARLGRARPPLDSPDGLGRPGRAAGHLPTTPATAGWTETEPGSWC